MAKDVGTVGYGEKDPDETIVEISMEDDDEIMFSFDNISIIIPADRIRQLL